MTARNSSRMRTRTETRLVDKMISAYVDWHEASRLVHDAYRSWASARGPAPAPSSGVTRRRSTRRSGRPRSMQACVRRVGHPATGDGDLSGPLAA